MHGTKVKNQFNQQLKRGSRGGPRKHRLPKGIASKSLNRQNFTTKNPLLGTYPLTNDELKKVHQENPASAIFTSIDPSCFHEY